MTQSSMTRRQAMVAAAGLLGAPTQAEAGATDTGATSTGATSTGATSTGATVTGRVFVDPQGLQSPGPFSAGPDSLGVPAVMVSNGRDVTVTDASGRYRLPITPGQSVFVIKPPGHALPVEDATKLPLFAYVHEPDGSPPGFRFRGLTPTGPLPESLDFPSQPVTEPDSFSVLLFTDPQPETLAELTYVRDDVVASAAADAPPDTLFGIAHGDLMFDDLSFYDRYNRILATTGLPWHSIPGNHDINVEAPDNVHSRDTFKRVFGARHHAFQVGRAVFILLDNVEYLGPDPAKPGQLGRYQGRFGPEQLQFVRNVLAQVPTDHLAVFSFHIPLRTAVSPDPFNNTVDLADFLQAISTHPNSISFCGHTHTNEHHYFDAADGFGAGTHHHHVLAAVSGSWWSGPFDVRGIPVALESDGSPNGYHVLEVRGTAHTTRLVPAHDPARGQIRIMLDSQVHRDAPEILGEYAPGALLGGSIPVDAVPSTRLVVNLFDGGPRSQVMLSLAGGELVPMQRVARTDPYVEEVYARNAVTKKPWVKPVLSTHVWQATLPADLGPGVHRVTVLATDEYGRERIGTAVLEISGRMF